MQHCLSSLRGPRADRGGYEVAHREACASRLFGQRMNLFGYVSFEYIKDMGTPDRYYSVCDDVTSGRWVA